MGAVAIDILGPDFRSKALTVAPHEVATLVRHLPGGRVPSHAENAARTALLYVHGFVDYFFQRHLAEQATDHGYDFYAVDLRHYGRSIKTGHLPNFVSDLNDHLTDIDAADRQVKDVDGHRRLVVMGHSMGGLIASLWAARRPGVADALVLNSPWLDLKGSRLYRRVLTPVMHVLGRIAPRLKVSRLAPYYGSYLLDPDGGGWEYRTDFKPIEGFPVRAAWISAIRRGQARVAAGLGIACPILVCCAAATGDDKHWHDRLDQTDSVLAVEDMLRLAPRLGPDVTIDVIDGGIHDLALSPEPARARYFEAVFGFLADRGL